ncbi:MAG: hypothetical protein R3F56_08330 [Planctomycetota bacterium]
MLRLLVVAAAVGIAPAQSVVVPATAANAEGNSVDREPFGMEGIRHLTYMHRRHLTQVPAQAAINVLAYRRDTSVPLQVMQRPPGIWQIRMGHYQGSVDQPPSAWPASWDPDWTVVFQPRQISFPDLNQPSGGGPAPFDLQFWLDQPYTYRGAHLGIEHFVADSQMRHDYFVDFVDGLVPGGTVDLLPGGQGCPWGSNRATGQAPNPGGGDAEFYLFDALPQAGVLLGVGTSDQTWAGVPLPLDLASAGLGGCKVLVSLDALVPVQTTSAGLAEVHWPIPGYSALLGASLYAQWVCPNDTRVSQSVPLTLSDGLKYTFGNNLNSGSMGMSVVSAFSGSNQNGYVQPNRGPVVQLRW